MNELRCESPISLIIGVNENLFKKYNDFVNLKNKYHARLKKKIFFKLTKQFYYHIKMYYNYCTRTILEGNNLKKGHD